MKAALGKKVKINLPKAFQTSKEQTKSLAVKGVPTDITDIEFKEFLYLNKISYAKAERLKAKRTAGSSQCFDLKLTTLPNPRLSFHKISLPSNRHCKQGERISISSFGHAVLQLPKFQSLG